MPTEINVFAQHIELIPKHKLKKFINKYSRTILQMYEATLAY